MMMMMMMMMSMMIVILMMMMMMMVTIMMMMMVMIMMMIVMVMAMPFNFKCSICNVWSEDKYSVCLISSWRKLVFTFGEDLWQNMPPIATKMIRNLVLHLFSDVDQHICNVWSEEKYSFCDRNWSWLLAKNYGKNWPQLRVQMVTEMIRDCGVAFIFRRQTKWHGQKLLQLWQRFWTEPKFWIILAIIMMTF